MARSLSIACALFMLTAYAPWAIAQQDSRGTGTSQTPPADYPRLHFDLHVTGVDEQEAEAARLVSLGASRIDWDSYPDDPDFIVLADPDGNRFCIVDLAHEYA